MACPNSPLMEVAFDVSSCQINRVFQSVIIATRVQPSPECFLMKSIDTKTTLSGSFASAVLSFTTFTRWSLDDQLQRPSPF